MTFNNILCRGFWLSQENTVLHVFKTQNRVHLCHIPCSSLLFPSGRPLHTQMLRPHLFKACKVFLFTNRHLTMEQDPTPHPKIKALAEGREVALPTEGPLGCSPSSAVPVRSLPSIWHPRQLLHTGVVSPKAGLHSSFAFPKLHFWILRCHTPHTAAPR